MTISNGFQGTIHSISYTLDIGLVNIDINVLLTFFCKKKAFEGRMKELR
jgi:hypothetical protein